MIEVLGSQMVGTSNSYFARELGIPAKGTNAHDGISLLYSCLNELLSRGTACPRVLASTLTWAVPPAPSALAARRSSLDRGFVTT